MNTLQVIIVHWNRPEECIRSVDAFISQSVDVSITVVDNHSEPRHLARLQEGLRGKAHIESLSENRGWGGGFNHVLSEWSRDEREEFCVLAAHDALPSENCLRNLMAALQRNAQYGIVSAEYGDESVPRFSCFRGPCYERVSRKEQGALEEVDFPHGTLMMCRRTCLQALGGFDERFFAYGDEFDLGIRARSRGWKVGIVWGAVVTNPGSWTPSPVKNYLFTRNALLLIRVHAGRRWAVLRSILVLCNTLRLLFYPPARVGEFYCEQFARTRLRAVADYFLGRWGGPRLSS